MKTFTSLMVGSFLLTGLAAHADNKWNDANNPKNFEPDYVYSYHVLPGAGSVEASGRGWADSYWPATYGYILNRWQQHTPAFKFKDYTLPNQADVLTMSQSDLNLLSPAEKFDILRGRYDLPLATDFKSGNPLKSDWWKGYCNGWVVASLNFTEPKAILYTSPVTGQTIPLASSDVKALLAYYYAVVDRSNAEYVGSACRGGRRLLSVFNGACADVNAAAFHVVVANELGLRKHGLTMDRDPGPQTWNQPYTGFESHTVSETTELTAGHTDGTVKEVNVSTTMTYVDELYNTTDETLEDDDHVAPSVNALGPTHQPLRTHTYLYTLELDKNDQIIGGFWADKYDHPDLIWRQDIDPKSIGTDPNGVSNGFEMLKDIVAKATAQ
jgi:hypothetical protein